jgi:urea transport system ATP-binding protein
MGVQKLTGGRILLDGRGHHRAAILRTRPRRHRLRAARAAHLPASDGDGKSGDRRFSALAGRGAGASGGIPDHIYELFPKLKQIRPARPDSCRGASSSSSPSAAPLSGQPKLLLLDEPTEGIQPSVVQQIEDALRRVRTELGVTIVIVEQYLDFAWSFADHYHVMQRGRIIRSGSTAEETAAEISHLVNI